MEEVTWGTGSAITASSSTASSSMASLGSAGNMECLESTKGVSSNDGSDSFIFMFGFSTVIITNICFLVYMAFYYFNTNMS